MQIINPCQTRKLIPTPNIIHSNLTGTNYFSRFIQLEHISLTRKYTRGFSRQLCHLETKPVIFLLPSPR